MEIQNLAISFVAKNLAFIGLRQLVRQKVNIHYYNKASTAVSRLLKRF